MADTPFPLPTSLRQTDVLIGDGRTTYGPFGEGWGIFDDDDVDVNVLPVQVAFTVEKVALSEKYSAFTVTFARALTAADTFQIKGKRRHRRELAVTRGGAIDGLALELELSKQSVVMQELDRDIDGAVGRVEDLENGIEQSAEFLAIVTALRDQTEAARDVVVLAEVDVAADVAAADADRIAAQQAAVDAAAASDAAFINANVYADTTAGLAAVALGEQFQVVDVGGLASTRYREDVGPVATPVATFPTKLGLDLAAASEENLWFDPWFDFVRNEKARLDGRQLVFDGSSVYDPNAPTALGTKGAWVFNTASLFGTYVYFEDQGIVTGDVISIGTWWQGDSGNYQIFYRFFDASYTLLGAQVLHPLVTANNTVQLLKFDTVAVPAGAVGVLVYANDAVPVAVNLKLLAQWVIKKSYAGERPPARLPLKLRKAFQQRMGHTALQSIFPDPTFKVLQNTSVALGGENLFHSTFTNRTWLPNLGHGYGLGAWQHSSGSATLTGFKKLFANAGLVAGDTFSIGVIFKADTVGGGMTVAARQFSSSDTTYLGVQTSSSVDIDGNSIATGSEQVFNIEGLVVDPATLGVAVYFYDGASATNINCLALWIVKGSIAGSMPPPNIHPNLIAYLAAGVDETPVVSADAVILPPRICAVAGRSLKLRNANLRIGTGPRNWNWDGSIGRQDNEGYIYSTPVAGEYTITANIHEPDSAALLGASTSLLSVQDANAPAGAARKLLVIGDSLTAANTWTQRLLDVDAANANSVQLTMIGTQGTAPNKHEGQGGWSVPRYHSPGVTFFAANPFTEISTSKFNFSYYLTNTTQTTPDIVAIMLGINDVFGQTSDAAAKSKADASIAMLDEIIGLTAGAGVTSLKSVSPTIKTLLVIEPFGHDEQDSYGVDYSLGQSQYRGRRNIGIYAKTLIDHYAASEADNVFLCAAHAVLDLAADYTSNGVHPNATGYNKIGDTVSDYINTMVAKGLL
jgi:lysophospholipase L1-like esterase